MFTQLLLLLFIVIVVVIIWRYKPSHKIVPLTIPDNTITQTLQDNVLYYQRLSDTDKNHFVDKVKTFLQEVRITGVGITADDTDKILVAASAMIPIFRFKNDWRYSNLTDVLLYPNTFDDSYDFKKSDVDRNILGMVGSGDMNSKMILSQPALREGFKIKTDKSNTAIHEFVHLLDMSDGAVDGMPEYLLPHQYAIPWLNLIHQQIDEIKKNESDINPYAATNKSEFFAVISEYFFERPDLLKEKHPDLYSYLDKIFDQKPLSK